MKKLKTISTEITALAKLCSCVTRVGLYGSMTTGKSHEKSDLDIAVQYDWKVPNGYMHILQFAEAVEAICRKHGHRMDMQDIGRIRAFPQIVSTEIRKNLPDAHVVQWFYPAAAEEVLPTRMLTGAENTEVDK